MGSSLLQRQPPKKEQQKDSREWNQMVLAFFWSVADCNRHGCAAQSDALCKNPNHKKTHKKREKEERK